MTLPDLERVAEAVHESWRARKGAEGVTTRPHPKTGDEQLLPWSEVSEVVKEENRALVRTVYAAIETLEAPDRTFPEPPEMQQSYPPRDSITPVWVAHTCPNCQRELLIDRVSLTVIRATDRPPSGA